MTEFKSEKDRLAFALFSDPSEIKVEKRYLLSEDDLKIIIEQTSCTEDEAREFYTKNKGNLEETIFDYLESNEIIGKLIKPKLVSDEELLNDNITTDQKMETYREILYHKDKVFQQKFDETSGFENRQMGVYEYIAFNPTTTMYRKLKFKGSKEYFSMEVLKSYITGEIDDAKLSELSKDQTKARATKKDNSIELDRKIEVEIVKDHQEEKKDDEEKKEEEEEKKEPEEEKKEPEEEKKEEEKKEDEEDEEEEPEKKIIIKTIVKKGLEYTRKWGLIKPVIAYMDVEEKDKKEANINALATKFMRGCGYLNDEQSIYGPAVVINNWYH